MMAKLIKIENILFLNISFGAKMMKQIDCYEWLLFKTIS
jgi:hypothetical protein